MLRQLGSWLRPATSAAYDTLSDERRRQLLDLFLAGTAATLVAYFALNVVQYLTAPSATLVVFLSIDLASLAFVGGLWFLSRNGQLRLPSLLYLGYIIVVISLPFSGALHDRLLIAYALPTLAASFLLTPRSSFFAAALSVLAYSVNYLTHPRELSYNFFFVILLPLLAVAAWFVSTSLHRVLRQVYESETHYQALVEQLPAFVYVTEFGRDGKWIYASPRVTTLFGYTPAEWMADPNLWYNLLHPDDVEAVTAGVAHSHATGEPLHLEYRIADRSGQTRWVRDDATILRLPGQRPRLQGVILDITRRKQTDAALRESEAKFRSLFEFASEAFIILQPPRGVIVDANLAAVQMFGYDKAELVGMEAGRLIAPEALAETRRNRRLQRNGQGFFNVDTAAVRRDGSRVRLTMSGRPQTVNEAGQFLVIARDVTERWQAEQALRQSEARNRAILDAIPDVMLRLSGEGVFLDYWAAKNELYLQPEEFIGRTLAEVFDADLAARALEHIARALASGQTELFEYQLVMAGSLRDYEARLVASGDHEVLAIIRDVTDRKAAEIARRASDERYRAVVEEQTELVCRFRPDGRLTFVNEAYCRNFGRSRESLLDSNFIADLPEDTRPQVTAYFSRFTPLNPVGTIEERFLSATGEVVWRQWTDRAFFDDAGRVVEFQAVGRDITERRRAEDALQASEAQFRSIYENSPVMMQSFDDQGRICNVNRKWVEETGYERDAVLGQPVEFYLTPAAHVTGVALPRFWRDSRLRDEPLQVVRQDGSVIDVLLSCSLATDAGGQRQGIAVILDVTERRRREQDLEAIAAVSAALRTANRRADMLPVILAQFIGPDGVLPGDCAAIAFPQPVSGELLIELGLGQWSDWTGERLRPGQGIGGYVLTTGRAYHTNKLEADPLFAQTTLLARVTSAVCVPLSAQGQTIGVLWVGSQRPILPAQVRLLTAVADIAANALRRAALHEQTRQNAEQLAAASAIGRALAETLELHQLYERLAHAVDSLLPGLSTVCLYWFMPDRERLRCVYAVQGNQPVDVEALAPVTLAELGLAGRTNPLPRGWPVLLEDWETPEGQHRRSTGESPLARSTLYVPMLARGELLGLLRVQSDDRDRLGQPDVELLSLIGNSAAVTIQNAQLLNDVQAAHLDLMWAYDATIEGWSRALELRDRDTEGHTRRVTELTAELARSMGLAAAELEQVRRGALLHDIGKMGIPDHILHKTGPLTDEEWVIMRRHPIYAFDMLSPIAYLRPALDIPYCHHEKWDGSGYPRQLKAEAIPLSARIFAVVDVWDALCSDRPYRPAWTPEAALAYIIAETGRHFDPAVVDAFVALIGVSPNIPIPDQHG